MTLPFLFRMAETRATAPNAVISSHLSALCLLARMSPGGIIVELGTQEGCSTIALLTGSEGKRVFSFDIDPKCEGRFRTNVQGDPDLSRWSFTACDSCVAARQFEDESVGLLFIDSNHTYEHTNKELVAWLPKIRPDGIICGHDYYLPGAGVKRAVDQLAAKHGERFRLQAFSSDCGLFILWPKGVELTAGIWKSQSSGRLLWTIATGALYQELGRLTHPLMESYARRIGADFIIVREVDKKYPHPSWGRMANYNYLVKYERVAFLDSDVVVKPGAPDLFSLVPPGKLGALVENFVNASRPKTIRDYFKTNGFPLNDADELYFNAGVLVASQAHRDLFEDPGRYPNEHYEQTLLNGRRWNLGIPLYDLGRQVHALVGFGHENSAPFVHFANRHGAGLVVEVRAHLIKCGLLKK